MRIAIIGSGVSGLVSAWLLGREHEITVYESEAYIGGHTHTIDLAAEGQSVDTGFIVFNHRNYPNFVRLLDALQVPVKPTSMSFSVMNRRSGLEYGFASLDTLFAQRRNLLRPSFWRMLLDIRRFRREFQHLQQTVGDDVALGDYLKTHGYSASFMDDFMIPFGAAIWSAAPDQMNRFPLKTFTQFFLNHGFLDPKALLQWYVVDGGSSTYVNALLRQFQGTVHTESPVTRVCRHPDHVEVTAAGQPTRQYDQVVLACHSDQALAMLADATEAEREVLGALPYQLNHVFLHSDVRLLPRHPKVWSSWNYCVDAQSDRVTVTYDMNILQGLRGEVEYLVTLNPVREIDAETIRGTYQYAHPIYRANGIAAQSRYDEIAGLSRRTHFAGAYWGYGFHEDGVNSALRACDAFGVKM